jgi:hypothetical protein
LVTSCGITKFEYVSKPLQSRSLVTEVKFDAATGTTILVTSSFAQLRTAAIYSNSEQHIPP